MQLKSESKLLQVNKWMGKAKCEHWTAVLAQKMGRHSKKGGRRRATVEALVLRGQKSMWPCKPEITDDDHILANQVWKPLLCATSP